MLALDNDLFVVVIVQIWCVRYGTIVEATRVDNNSYKVIMTNTLTIPYQKISSITYMASYCTDSFQEQIWLS